MDYIRHQIKDIQIAEIKSEHVVIASIEDATDLIGNSYYQGFDGIIVPEKGISPDFFDLKTGLAGEILQKFSNYRMRLVIAGDFSQYISSKSLRDFIYECNKGKQVGFVASIEEGIALLEG